MISTRRLAFLSGIAVFLAALVVGTISVVVMLHSVSQKRALMRNCWSNLHHIHSALQAYQVRFGCLPSTGGQDLALAVLQVLEAKQILRCPSRRRRSYTSMEDPLRDLVSTAATDGEFSDYLFTQVDIRHPALAGLWNPDEAMLAGELPIVCDRPFNHEDGGVVLLANGRCGWLPADEPAWDHVLHAIFTGNVTTEPIINPLYDAGTCPGTIWNMVEVTPEKRPQHNERK